MIGRVLAGLGLALGLLAEVCAGAAAGPAWLRDEAAAFERARVEQRPVLLYLEAVWCHWCHVMDERTYSDGELQALIHEHYVPLRIDQDSRPDLAARYRDVGWPATVIFDAQGREVLKRQGYLTAPVLARLLRAVLADPSPEAASRLPPEQAPPPEHQQLTASLRSTLLNRHRRSVDLQRGGLKMAQRYLDRDSVEYSLLRGAAGDGEELQRARITLDAARALLDPVWGGVYQYSTGGDWKHPHYEKLTALQAEYLRIYALAFAVTGDVRYREVVGSLRAYLAAFMRDPAGGYYVSQDADLRPGEHSAGYYQLDDAGRRALGVPRIDRHRYTRENALVAEALAYWHEVSGDADALREATATLQWLQAERRAETGYRHDSEASGGPYLADNLAVLRACLQLYRSGAQRAWLDEAAWVARAIETHLRARSGYLASPAGSARIPPVAPLDEGIALARALSRLARYSGDAQHRAMAEHAMRHLARADIAVSRFTDVGIVLADDEFARDPLHLTVVGGKQDVDARRLFDAALRVADSGKRLEWWDPAEGPLPNPDVRYPSLPRAAAFVCNEGRCSTPIHEAAEVAAFVAEERERLRVAIQNDPAAAAPSQR